MLVILVCLDAWHTALVTTGYATPVRQAVVVVLSGIYLAGFGWWAGSRIVAAWRSRDRDDDQWI